jgi:hypothetical protein
MALMIYKNQMNLEDERAKRRAVQAFNARNSRNAAQGYGNTGCGVFKEGLQS